MSELKKQINVLEKEKRSLEKQQIEYKAEIKHSTKLIEELKTIKDGLCEKCKILTKKVF
jgi:septal ring factor EnvC (AmiA/AmiB activator)